MRKLSLIILTMTLALSSCRKTPDYVPYIGETSMLAYSSYAEQFEVLWNNINTGYVFWDVDKTDWDAVYEEYMPQFETLDLRRESGKAVKTEELQKLYDGAMGGLIDHHMLVYLKNMYPNPNETSVISVRPGDKEVVGRDYYFKDSNSLSYELTQLLKKIASNGNPNYTIEYGGMENANVGGSHVTVCYILFKLDDGRIVPYLWQNSYNMSSILASLNNPKSQNYKAAQLIDTWKNAALKTPRERLAGIILDNRCNNGGSSGDLNHVIGPFIKKDYSVMSTRYKEGPGRLEHSVWSPITIEPAATSRDLADENIPYVVLSNIFSISMGEITTYGISQLPTGYVIGERTYGATGPLLSDAIDLTYGGPFGDMDDENHYVYTSTYEIKTHEGFVPEGVGFTPNKEILTKTAGVNGQLDEALKYIKNYK